MNDKTETDHAGQPVPIDGRLFDLLVDGELDSARQQDLLLRLDATPDGWRRCALAFLEAQAWRGDLRATMAAPAAGTPHDIGRGTVTRSRVSLIRHWSLLALGMMLAFGAGWLTRPQEGIPQRGGFTTSTAGVSKHTAPSDETVDNTAPESDETAPLLPSSMRMAGMLTFQVDDHGQTREVRVPVLDASGIDVKRLLEHEPTVRAAAIQALERRGHKVETHRQVLTVDLKDGRKLLLPIDQVDVRAANRVYQ